jgi:aminotransferase
MLPLSGIRRMFNLAATMKDVIHLSIGQPDFPTPAPIVEAHVKALREDKTHYTMDAGLPELLEALAAYYGARYGRPLTPENFLETTGGSEAIYLAITSLAAPGREVIVIEPSFVLFQPLAGMMGAAIRRIVTRADRGYQVDPEEVIAAMGRRRLNLNSPDNPTGTVYPREAIGSDRGRGRRTRSRRDQRRGVRPAGARWREYPSVLGWLPTSRAHRRQQRRPIRCRGCGRRVVSGNKNIETLRRYHMFTTTVGNTPAQWAAAAAVQGDQSAVDAMVSEYRKRRDRIVDLVAATPHLTGYRPEGAFYIMPSLPAGTDGTDVALRLLSETGVCTIPGSTFGDSCRNALRISYATSLDRIEAAFERMIPWFEKQSF